eukprot:scaffold66474_cov48-Phaeocystis_antarctica.AAC.4
MRMPTRVVGMPKSRSKSGSGKPRERAGATPSLWNDPEHPCLRFSSLPSVPSSRHMIVHGS